MDILSQSLTAGIPIWSLNQTCSAEIESQSLTAGIPIWRKLFYYLHGFSVSVPDGRDSYLEF